MEQAAAALGEATIALEAAEESLKNLVMEGKDMDTATGETITPEIVAATAASALEEGVGVLKTLLQQEDWESVPTALETEYAEYVQQQTKKGHQVLGTHKWYVTEKVLPTKLEGILKTLDGHLKATLADAAGSNSEIMDIDAQGREPRKRKIELPPAGIDAERHTTQAALWEHA